MEIGLGFLVGALSGIVIAIIVAVIVSASRKAVAGATRIHVRPRESETAAATKIVQLKSKTSLRSAPPPDGDQDMVVDQVEAGELLLDRSIQEVRELILRLANVVGTANNASGQATVAFNSAKSAIGSIDPDQPSGLIEAQRILVGEINRVLKSNAELHVELDRANQGITEQRRQIEELRIQARIDGLTRIPNRAAFDERLREYLALLKRTNLVFCLLLLDIDYFKRVNDTHGHLNGDRILRGVAAKITDSIRTNDFAARYGGEEFAVILPGSNLEAARAVADRVLQDISRTNFRLDDQNVRMTVSGGLVQCVKGMDAESLVAAADKALYQAKSGGRNCLRTEEISGERGSHER